MGRPSLRAVAAVLLAVAVCTTLWAPTVASARQSTGTVTVTTPSKVVTADAGTVAVLPLSFSDARRATVTVGSAATGWNATVEVTDADRDGTVRLRLDTGNVHLGRTVFGAAGADSVDSVTVHTAPSTPLTAGAYPVSVRTGGRETDVATLSLRRPDTVVCSRNVDPLVEEYNRSVGDVPWFLKGLVSDATLGVTVNGDRDGQYTLVTATDRRITDVRTGAPSDPSVTATTDCGAVTTLVDAENTTAAFQRAYRNGDVQIRGQGLSNAVVVEAVKLVDGLVQWFGDL